MNQTLSDYQIKRHLLNDVKLISTSVELVHFFHTVKKCIKHNYMTHPVLNKIIFLYF